MSAIAPGPGFRLSRGRALRRACLRRRARNQKEGPAATALKKPLFYQSSMLYPEVISRGFFQINVCTLTTFSVSGGSNFLIKICQTVATMSMISRFNEFYKFNFWRVFAIWHNCGMEGAERDCDKFSITPSQTD